MHVMLYVSPTWASLGTCRSPSGRNVVQLNYCLMKNRDMCYLSKDKTHPNRSSMSKNFYNEYVRMYCVCVCRYGCCNMYFMYFCTIRHLSKADQEVRK